ncbi:MAG: glycosyl hydrolase family 18 protein [Candidatus Pacebacteria bacterium]|nr:glycosyl hydrolase family 18 protein [Candidatus Paceibacterota bacterium]
MAFPRFSCFVLFLSLWLLACVAFLHFFLSPLSVHAQTAVMAAAPASAFGERIFYYSTSKSTAADFAAHVKDIDIIAPQTYEITAALTASGTVPTDLAEEAHASGTKVMPLIANHDFSQSIIDRFLSSATAESALTGFLVGEAQSKGYIGWQFDFEHVLSADRGKLCAFVGQAGAALHAHGLVLSVAVVSRAPGTESDDPTSAFYKNWSGAYDYAYLASSTDFLSLMAYDDPDSTTASAPLPYVKSVLGNILSQVPPSKISLGVPLFYWGWTTGVPPVRLSSSGTFAEATYRANAYPSFQGFNATIETPWVIYRIGKKIYKIWYENAQSFSLKAALIGQYHLRGFSAWVLGNEDPSIWGTIGN